MTLSDPLLKELKGHIAKLACKPGPYGDDDESVFLICHCLECIFRKGVIRHDGFTPWKTDCFQWFYQLIRKYHRVIPLVFKVAFDEVVSNEKTKTQTGKARLLIRTCLKRRCLHVPLQFHIENNDFNDDSLRISHNPKTSILGHEILSQIFLSLVLQLSNYTFNFDLSNSSFLDESWQIPILFKTELVPFDKLGITLGYPIGFPVIVEIQKNSLADEISDKISIGDIVDEINGIFVRHFFGSKMQSLLHKHRCQPIRMTFIKGRDPRTGQIYLPVIKLYRILGLNPDLYEDQNYYQEHPQLIAINENQDMGSASEQCNNQLAFNFHPNSSQVYSKQTPIFPSLDSSSNSNKIGCAKNVSEDLINIQNIDLESTCKSSQSTDIAPLSDPKPTEFDKGHITQNYYNGESGSVECVV